jgi:predicted nucleic acid-binding protein
MKYMILFDTDFLFSFFDANQSTHEQALQLLQIYSEEDFLITNLVKQELATVISRRKDAEAWKKISEGLDLWQIKNYHINSDETLEIWTLFNFFKTKNISFIDCANLYLARKLKCQIASFDTFYKEKILS